MNSNWLYNKSIRLSEVEVERDTLQKELDTTRAKANLLTISRDAAIKTMEAVGKERDAARAEVKDLMQINKDLGVSHQEQRDELAKVKGELSTLLASYKETNDKIEWATKQIDAIIAERDTLKSRFETSQKEVERLKEIITKTVGIVDPDCPDYGAYEDGHCGLPEVVQDQLRQHRNWEAAPHAP